MKHKTRSSVTLLGLPASLRALYGTASPNRNNGGILKAGGTQRPAPRHCVPSLIGCLVWANIGGQTLKRLTTNILFFDLVL